MGDISAALGDAVALAIKAQLAPLAERCATLTAELAILRPEVGALRERLAAAEARPPVPGPPGPAGANGTDGAAGFTCDELTLAQDAEDPRVLTLAYRRGEVTKAIGTARFTIPRYCGRFERERTYAIGDQVTWNGSLWHCHAATAAGTATRPAPECWTLQVKNGEGK